MKKIIAALRKNDKVQDVLLAGRDEEGTYHFLVTRTCGDYCVISCLAQTGYAFGLHAFAMNPADWAEAKLTWASRFSATNL